ncbi:MAG: hypothetical protein DSO07_00050 [Thermoproteota archaeon]|jgi:hypothetical protein|uniref:Uncharacterized protein n=1 Tax=Candidatus Methanodesulfokora washburnensis TaxID=2478471 RepID=A0A3R9PEB9_9CREN|nr:hypothetical protein [Candidatus Methanodesulfokores washburnensis]RSN74088.1 hypothetical protein D6D85_08850 [Candidatus Methanodesulfokores washburnensis]TDA42302.1 MAG: hypothetical protein DSO07_00050 [Candidatus Korarchaeota archaeon]
MRRGLSLFILLLIFLLQIPQASGEEVRYEHKVVVWSTRHPALSSKAEVLENGTTVLRPGGFLKYEINLPFELPAGSYLMLMASVSSDSRDISVIQVKVRVNEGEYQLYNLTVLHGVFFPQFIYFGKVEGRNLSIWIFHHRSVLGNASLLLTNIGMEFFIPVKEKAIPFEEYFMGHLGNLAGKVVVYKKEIRGKVVEVYVDYRTIIAVRKTEYCGLNNMPPSFSIDEQVDQWRGGFSKNRMYNSVDGCWYYVYFPALYKG